MRNILLLTIGVMCLSMAFSAIMPRNDVLQPLSITGNFNFQPAPAFKIPPLPTLTLPTFPTIPSIPRFPTVSTDNPCGLRAYCGQASNFRTQKQFKAFTDKNCPSDMYYPFFKTAQAQAVTSTPDFSGTNNQQANVDEADILKTDGKFIYSVSGNILSIIKAYPHTETQVMSTLSFTSVPSSLFVEGNYLTIFGTDYEQTNIPSPSPLPKPIDRIQPIETIQPAIQPAMIAVESKISRPIYFSSRPYTWVYVYDLTNKSRPRLVKDYKISGYYFNGRKADDTGFVYILSQLDCNQVDGVAPWYNFGSGKKNMTLQQIFYYPKTDYQNPNFINIFTFNLRNPLGCEENVISVISMNAYILYMSENYIYLTSTEWLADTQQTKIHKIFVSRSRIIPMADGSVTGYVNNQFSLDEFKGILRIATTENGITGVSSNNVFCLDNSLNVIGSLRNIAPTQTIFSARYVDTRLYLVTFRRIDPFFVIDLANPRLPTILGQLKITGFSNYLHPYDANTVIGFGQETDDQGRQIGLKVSLFDVKNVSSPQSLADFVLQQQYVYSTAQWEHKAFLFSREKNLMVVPASYYDWQNGENSPNSFNGALVFYIKRDATGGSVQLRAIVNHVLKQSDQFWDRQVQRSLYIDNLLYTKSRCLMRVHSLERLQPLVNLNLNCDYDPIIEPRPVSSPIFNPLPPAQIPGPIPVL